MYECQNCGNTERFRFTTTGSEIQRFHPETRELVEVELLPDSMESVDGPHCVECDAGPAMHEEVDA